MSLAEVARTMTLLPMLELDDPDTLGEAAVALAAAGWQVFPLSAGSKVPMRGTRGVLDATDDLEVVVRWWTSNPNANIGLALPATVLVLDVDHRNGGDKSLDDLTFDHGPLTPTLTVRSGGGGGFHYYYRHPGSPITQSNLPAGIDLKYQGGYMVAPPSRVTNAYKWVSDHPISDPPAWLVNLITRTPARPVAVPKVRQLGTGRTPAEWFDSHTTWAEILEPLGWHLVGGDGDADGTSFRHPTATSPISATVAHGCLFVYSPNAGLKVTTAGDPHGYTRFRAWCDLNRVTMSDGARRVRLMMEGAA